MAKILIWIWLFGFSFSGFAQSKITGKVTDASTNEALPGVVVYVYNKNVVSSYVVSQSDGNYTVTIDGPFTHLVFYHMGYKSRSIDFKERNESSYRADLQMEEDAMTLKSITIKPVAVAVKGDTVVYDAHSFRRNGDKSLGEVLRRLPNVQVNTSGGVIVQGTRINKFYIEDMDLLGGRYGIAVNNIRAEDIASISVYNNHQPVKVLKGVEAISQAALNIKLKEKAKNRWLLSFGVAAGFPSFLYSAKLNAMNFSRASQTFVTVKTDNSGVDIIKETVVRNLQPGYYSIDQLTGGIKDLFPIPRPRLPVPDEYYYINRSNAFTINRLNKLKNGTTVKGNVVFTTNRTSNDISTQQTVTPATGEIITITDTSGFKQNEMRVSGEFTITSNREKAYVEDVLSFKVLMDKVRSHTVNSVDIYRQRYSLPKYVVENKLSYVKGKRKTVYKLYNTLHYSHLNEDLTVISDNPNPLFNSSSVVQNLDADNFTADTYLSFVKKVAKVSFSFTPGVNLWYKEYASSLEPPVAIPGGDNGILDCSNDLSLFSLQPYFNVSARYRYKKMEWDVSMPVGLRYDVLNGNGSVYFTYRPFVQFGYEISPEFTLQARASVSNQIGDIETMAPGYIYSSYRNFYAYESVSKQMYQYYRGMLRYSSYASFWLADLFVSYGVDASNLMPSDLFMENYTFTVYTDEHQLRNTLDAGLNVKKFLGINKYKIGAGIKYTRNHSEQYLQGQLYEYKTDAYNANIECSCSPSDVFMIEYRADFTRNVFKTEESNAINHLINKLAVSVFPIKKLELRGTFFHFFQSRPGYENVSLPFLDFKIEYKIRPKLSVYCKMDNVINIKNYSSTYFSGVSTINKNTRLRGAGYLFGISLDF